jgi:hypothetical protein
MHLHGCGREAFCLRHSKERFQLKEIHASCSRVQQRQRR